MTDNGLAGTPAAGLGNLAADRRRLHRDGQQAKDAEAIAKSRQGVAEARAASLKSLLPAMTNAPRGAVTLGASAGAFGPWRAHQVIGAIAAQIAKDVVRKLVKPERKAGADADDRAVRPALLAARVLVVDDRAILAGDWTARQVGLTLDRLAQRVGDLRDQLAEGAEKLRQGSSDLAGTSAVEGSAADGHAGPPDARPPDAGLRPRDLAMAGTTTGPAGGTGAAVPGALDGAIDMLGLIRTDFTLTASTVTPGPAELVTLTAAHLAALGVRVESDALAVTRSSPSMEKFSALLTARDKAVEAIFTLDRDLAAPQAERVTAPARVLLDYARQVIADVDAAAGALTLAPAGGQSPLYVAACRERLAKEGAPNGGGASAADAITHVLYVSLDSVTADTVTRQSVLGSSGIMRFLAAGNGSWLLLDTATGTIAAGSQESHADVMSFSLVSGQASYGDVPSVPRAQGPLSDPTALAERATKALVLALAAAVAIVGILSVIAVIRIAIY